MSERLPRTRAKLRIVLGSVLRPLGWKSAGARRWERNHGEFLQTVFVGELQEAARRRRARKRRAA